MFVWAHEGISDAAAVVLAVAGHTVVTDQEWYPWPAAQRHKFVLWTRLSPFWGSWHPAVVTWQPELVATPCTDASHCDHARARGVKVLSLRDCGDLSSIRGTVEFTIGAVLALTRRIPSAAESVRRGEWDRMKYQGTDLHGKIAAVIGYGRIGKAVSKVLSLLGMKVWPYDSDPFVYAGMTLDYTLSQADIVTVHASLNQTSRGMFGAAQFATMKRGAYFINTARGAIVDEAALLASLESGHLAGAALDVLCEEPLKLDNPLLAFARENPERLLLTPHLAGCSRESLEKAEVLLARKLCEVLANGGS